MLLKKLPLFCVAVIAVAGLAHAQELYPVSAGNSLWHNQQRTLRYQPNGKAFVIKNGTRLFTRALYGTHTAFRVETGDRPEFALYMPGMGGNFKLGIGYQGKTKWLTQAANIDAQYTPGQRSYTLTDTLLGQGKLHLVVLAMADAEGMVIRAWAEGLKHPVDLYWAFGGATGKKFSRDGDMGPDPEWNYYLKPEYCAGNNYTLDGQGSFTLVYGKGASTGSDGRYFAEDKKATTKSTPPQVLVGVFNPAGLLKLADASALASPGELYQSSAQNAPVVCGKLTIKDTTALYFAIQNPATKPAGNYATLPGVYTQAQAACAALANRVQLNTPDAYLNTLGGALVAAADGIWEEPSYMHGAIGWRMRLNGWRGPYVADVLGWHDRAHMHLAAYAQSQVLNPQDGPITPDSAFHFARGLEKMGAAMFTSGYISRDPNGQRIRPHHYDMNLVYTDQLLRHYEWTADTAFMRKTWPVLQRHLDWETRVFDVDGNGLYDAYAAIWASDALQYSGGDVTHSSAYNYLAYKRAAQIAQTLGYNAQPYQQQANKILAAMNKWLWMPQLGRFAEYKDAMGKQLQHPAAALWTVYHSIDSEVPDAFQTYQLLRYVDKEIPHIPVKAAGLDADNYYTLSTTNWMPYQWSLNNVVMAESMHTALANWQGGRADEAFRLFKSEILASMYMGGSPGNVVQISYYDAIRGEAYRDFGDPIGMTARALVEGLFGIVPDGLSHTLHVRPGLPYQWNFAHFATPDVSFDFKRQGTTDTYLIGNKLPGNMALQLQLTAHAQVKQVLLNGKPASYSNAAQAVGRPNIIITAPAAPNYRIDVQWTTDSIALPPTERSYAKASNYNLMLPASAQIAAVNDPQQALAHISFAGNKLSAQVSTNKGNRTLFVQVKQKDLSWWMPLCFSITDSVAVSYANGASANNSSFTLSNNTTAPLGIKGSVNGYSFSKKFSGGVGSTVEVSVPAANLQTGTNVVQLDLGNGHTQCVALVNWQAKCTLKTRTVDLSAYFNDKVTQIFQNKYLSPRPKATTLQLPWQGIGDWPHPLEDFNVDDSGLRRLAGSSNQITLPQGISFATPGKADEKNIVFTSQWDNYPHQQSIALSGQAQHAWLLMAGSTNPMQSQIVNGLVVVNYTDGTTDTLALKNPETWWPIEQDYYTDGYAFALKATRPIRIHLKTGEIVQAGRSRKKDKGATEQSGIPVSAGDLSTKVYDGEAIPGGAATVLDMPLNPHKTLKSLSLQTVANDVVIGLMAVTLGE